MIKNCLRKIARGIGRGIICRTGEAVDIEQIARRRKIDLLPIAYRQLGILNFRSSRDSGEAFVVERILPVMFDEAVPVVIDVGANRGDYAMEILHQFPQAVIHAFEPNPVTFRQLSDRFQGTSVRVFSVGCGAEPAQLELFDYTETAASAHASLYSAVLTDIHSAAAAISHSVVLTTLDDHCRNHGVARIDMLKIDTEGHELAVLQGAGQLLAEGRVGAIQFEFNEMNAFSRVWLKDFFDLLPDRVFYRLDSDRLIPLGKYNPRNEIFAFQNILAVPAKLAERLVGFT